MQMDNSQSGDWRVGDVAGTITRISLQSDAQIVLLQEMLARIARLERVSAMRDQTVQLNALVTAALLASAIFRYVAGNRRA